MMRDTPESPEAPQKIKREVRYSAAFMPLRVGAGAVVKPLDHTSPLVSNLKPILTSPVVRVDYQTGDFETRNSLYRRVSVQ